MKILLNWPFTFKREEKTATELIDLGIYFLKDKKLKKIMKEDLLEHLLLAIKFKIAILESDINNKKIQELIKSLNLSNPYEKFAYNLLSSIGIYLTDRKEVDLNEIN